MGADHANTGARATISRRAALAGMGAGASLILTPRTSAAAGSDPRVRTIAGPVTGFREGGVQVFKGVRYGAPTQRFQPPRRPTPWRDPVRATDFGAASRSAALNPIRAKTVCF